MPTYYSLDDYRSSGPQFGMISMRFDQLTEQIEKMGRPAGADKILGEELRAFGRDVIAPVYRAFSPYKGGGSANSRYEWLDDYRHLQDSLRTEMRGNRELVLRMRKHGVYTVEGNGSGRIVAPKGKMLRIELPGGEVIYRRSVKSISPEQKRWALDAWIYIKRQDYYTNLMKRISLRMLASIFPNQKGLDNMPSQSVAKVDIGPRRARSPGRSPSAERAHIKAGLKARREEVALGQHKALLRVRSTRYLSRINRARRRYNYTGNLEYKRQHAYYTSLLRHQIKQYQNHERLLGRG